MNKSHSISFPKRLPNSPDSFSPERLPHLPSDYPIGKSIGKRKLMAVQILSYWLFHFYEPGNQFHRQAGFHRVRMINPVRACLNLMVWINGYYFITQFPAV